METDDTKLVKYNTVTECAGTERMDRIVMTKGSMQQNGIGK